MEAGTILLVEDEPSVRLVLKETLKERGYDVVEAVDGSDAARRLERRSFDLVITDVRLPRRSGLDLIEGATDRGAEVLLMTAFGSIPEAVEAVKRGAFQYLTKPIEPAALLPIVRRAMGRSRARRSPPPELGALVGESDVMRDLFRLMERAARSTVTVLITGESGTGKELVARGIHEKSDRTGSFVAVNCGALPETLLESELFGYERGAFTGADAPKRGLFEEAAGGTLFLDEIGELPMQLQVKLNRVIQERSVRRLGGSSESSIDVRIIAATNLDLREEVKRRRFREDLLYRLDVFAVETPPLRDRRGDIPLLAATFLQRHGDGRVTGFTSEAFDELVRRPWPGNVRELENAVQRALAMTHGTLIGRHDVQGRGLDGRSPMWSTTTLSLKENVALAKTKAARRYLCQLMDECEGSVARAAERAGMRRESLYRLLRKHGLAQVGELSALESR